MKIRCPRCEKLLSVPEKYAGKAIRCPGCNQAFKVPALTAAVGGGAGGGLDLEDLARIEQGTSQLSEEELAAHVERQAGEIDAEAEIQSGFRTCPHCQKKTKATDPNVELLCSHCWKGIPSLRGGGLGRKTIKQATTEVKATGEGGFYNEIGSAFAYPFSALSSILTASGIAFGAAIIPVAVMTALSNLMEQSNVGTEQGIQKADLSNLVLILMGIFAAEVFFFSAIAIHSFFDVVRTTGVRDDQPPKLNFAPSQWGKSFMSYVVLCVYVGILAYVVFLMTMPADLDFMGAIAAGEVQQLLQNAPTEFYIGMFVISFLIPMNLIGISLGTIGQALNPVRVGQSVGYTHVHYIFLVLILSVYGGLFSYSFSAILFDWFIPKIKQMQEGSTSGQLTNVALPLLAWGAVMAVFFYGTYVLARLHGLFVRSFRRRLMFGTD
ncbi:MAG TPA: hypothetical protein VNT79_04455 [Phycisphaerae bacterium]|nr:hypothetical protein [Phycisphaerae bacterium]